MQVFLVERFSTQILPGPNFFKPSVPGGLRIFRAFASLFQDDGMVVIFFWGTIALDGFSMVLLPLDHHHYRFFPRLTIDIDGFSMVFPKFRYDGQRWFWLLIPLSAAKTSRYLTDFQSKTSGEIQSPADFQLFPKPCLVPKVYFRKDPNWII